MSTTVEQRRQILEAALMVAGRPLSIADMQKLFDENDEFSATQMRDILHALSARYAESGIELKELASGFQFQARTEWSPWLSKLWEERAPRFSRAMLETLALIAYRQPITRAEIEEIRGVVVSSNIIKTLQEREWIRVIGYKDLPGKPALFATTKTFLDHLNLKNLGELPPLADIIDLESQEEKLHVQLELQESMSLRDVDTVAPHEDSDDVNGDDEENGNPLADEASSSSTDSDNSQTTEESSSNK